MSAITLGNPNLFLKGVAEQTMFDPATGDIVGYDNVATEAAITATVNLQEITGGVGNPVVGVLPDSVRLTGTYTSQAFSLETRKLISGGALTNGSVAPVCEQITASSTTLTITGTPAKHIMQSASDTKGWCFVREHGATKWSGQNYGVDIDPSSLTYKNVGFPAVSGTTYDVFYFSYTAAAKSLAIPDVFNPEVVGVQTKYAVFAKQNNSVSMGTLHGLLYVVVPQAILNGDVGVNGNQTANATTSMNWMALSPDSTMACANSCAIGNNLAYYIYVPCDPTSVISELVTIGSMSVDEGETSAEPIPVKFLTVDDALVEPNYADLTFDVSGDPSLTVDAAGYVTSVTGDNTYHTVNISTTLGGEPYSTTFLVFLPAAS